MKYKLNRVALIALILSMGGVRDVRSQWQLVGGPSDSTVRIVSCIDTSLFAGTQWGVYRSSDNGNNWIASDSGL